MARLVRTRVANETRDRQMRIPFAQSRGGGATVNPQTAMEKPMEQRVVHSTFVIERQYPAAPERVFAAFSDPVKKQRWFAGSDEGQPGEFTMDFRVGGVERTTRHHKNGWVFTNDTVYRDIIPARRIVFAYNMSLGEQRISSSLATVELLPKGNGTELIFTEQSAFFEGADGPSMRKEGWQKLLDRLNAYLTAS